MNLAVTCKARRNRHEVKVNEKFRDRPELIPSSYERAFEVDYGLILCSSRAFQVIPFLRGEGKM